VTSSRVDLARLLEASAGHQPRTPAERLRLLLSELEIRVTNMAGAGEEVLRIPVLMDEAAALLEDLRGAGGDVKPEEARWSTVQGLLRRRAAEFVRQARQGGGLKAARAVSSPPPDHWWWYLDQWVATQRRRALRRALLLGLATVAALVLVGWLVQRQVWSNPTLQRTLNLEQEVDIAMAEGRWRDALGLLGELATLNPDKPIYILEAGVVHELLGEQEKAQEAYAQARARMGPVAFYVARAQLYQQMGRPEAALEDAQRAIALNPDSAQAYFQKGLVLEQLGRPHEALQAMQRAASLAEANHQTELLAVIRVRMAFLMQRGPFPTSTPETP